MSGSTPLRNNSTHSLSTNDQASPSTTPGRSPRSPRPGLPKLNLCMNQQHRVGNTLPVDQHGNFSWHDEKLKDSAELSIKGQKIICKPDELRILCELGRGTFGVVYKVLHEETGTTMAVKGIPLDVSESACKQIITELDVLQNSQCPYIVDFYGACYKEGDIRMFMEYMDGGSLEKMYQTLGPIPENIVGKICFAMVTGLNYLKEEHHVIHRDVKPSNVLCNTKGEIKICDFSVSGELVKSIAHTYVGSSHYMAPERIKGSKEYSIRSDVWSLGISIVEMVTGQYPYPRTDSVFAMLTCIVNKPSPDISDRCSPALADFVAQCLRKEPDERPTYQQLLEHEFLVKYRDMEVDVKSHVLKMMEELSSSSSAAAAATGGADQNGAGS
eukprot:Nk52_evm8s578 gene=Nk52_evmTU8s578